MGGESIWGDGFSNEYGERRTWGERESFFYVGGCQLSLRLSSRFGRSYFVSHEPPDEITSCTYIKDGKSWNKVLARFTDDLKC
jgi:hypothetical protein